MIWPVVLFVVNAVAFALLFARFGGVEVPSYAICTHYLVILGVGTLVYVTVRSIFRFPVPGEPESSNLPELGRRLRESTTHALAWLSVGMGFVMIGDRFLASGGIAVTCAALILNRLFHRYNRWRALCLRREADERHKRA